MRSTWILVSVGGVPKKSSSYPAGLGIIITFSKGEFSTVVAFLNVLNIGFVRNVIVVLRLVYDT